MRGCSTADGEILCYRIWEARSTDSPLAELHFPTFHCKSRLEASTLVSRLLILTPHPLPLFQGSYPCPKAPYPRPPPPTLVPRLLPLSQGSLSTPPTLYPCSKAPTLVPAPYHCPKALSLPPTLSPPPTFVPAPTLSPPPTFVPAPTLSPPPTFVPAPYLCPRPLP